MSYRENRFQVEFGGPKVVFMELFSIGLVVCRLKEQNESAEKYVRNAISDFIPINGLQKADL